MQSAANGFNELWNPKTVRRQHRAVIAGTVYEEKDIIGLPVTRRTLFAGRGGPSIGGCPSAQLDITVIPIETIPRMARIEMQTRLVQIDLETQTEIAFSDWIQKGIFYIDTREEDRQSGALTIHGYDAMLKAESIYMSEGDTGEWPRPCTSVVDDISVLMGVELDARTVLDPTILIPHPNDWTMREILGYTAAAHCGNFVISETGTLLLMGFGQEPQSAGVLVDHTGAAIKFGGVRILV